MEERDIIRNRIVVYRGRFVSRGETEGEYFTFTNLTGRFKGILSTTESGKEICNVNFWEPEESRMTVLRLWKRNALSLLMPMVTWDGRDDRMRISTRLNGSDWTAFDISTGGRTLQWAPLEIPEDGTFREIFIDRLIENINTKLLRLHEETGATAQQQG